MDYYPAHLCLAGKKCLVVGGRHVAERKVYSLHKAGAKIQVVSPDATNGIKELTERGEISYQKDCYSSDHLEGVYLVIAATNNRNINKRIGKEARQLGILVNVVDSQYDSTFISPAVFRKDGLVVSVSTGGESPLRAKNVRDTIGKSFDQLTDSPELKRSYSKVIGKPGVVYLVGAGPGDPDLITAKGLNLIQQADVILFDRLVGKELLMNAKYGAELIYVGKRSSKHDIEQDSINGIMISKARQRKVVLRLKGGDPSIFGRVGEEMLMLKQHGIQFEIIPGVSSFYSVPMAAGIPLTHRNYSSSVGIVTGREDPSKTASKVRWAELATGVDTLVILMGVKNLRFIVQQLIKNGRSPDTPVGLVRCGTTSSQEILTGILSNIVLKVKQANFKPPAVIVVGDVVSLHSQLVACAKLFRQDAV